MNSKIFIRTRRRRRPVAVDAPRRSPRGSSSLCRLRLRSFGRLAPRCCGRPRNQTRPPKIQNLNNGAFALLSKKQNREIMSHAKQHNSIDVNSSQLTAINFLELNHGTKRFCELVIAITTHDSKHTATVQPCCLSQLIMCLLRDEQCVCAHVLCVCLRVLGCFPLLHALNLILNTHACVFVPSLPSHSLTVLGSEHFYFQ